MSKFVKYVVLLLILAVTSCVSPNRAQFLTRSVLSNTPGVIGNRYSSVKQKGACYIYKDKYNMTCKIETLTNCEYEANKKSLKFEFESGKNCI